MSNSRHHRTLTAAVGLLAVLVVPTAVAPQGVIAGTVVRSGTPTPVEGAQIAVEGQRLNDIIRFNITLSPAAGTPFKNGGVYGSTVGSQACFPLADVERNNNPNI
jgi:hypothetical protein